MQHKAFAARILSFIFVYCGAPLALLTQGLLEIFNIICKW